MAYLSRSIRLLLIPMKGTSIHNNTTYMYMYYVYMYYVHTCIMCIYVFYTCIMFIYVCVYICIMCIYVLCVYIYIMCLYVLCVYMYYVYICVMCIYVYNPPTCNPWPPIHLVADSITMCAPNLIGRAVYPPICICVYMYI